MSKRDRRRETGTSWLNTGNPENASGLSLEEAAAIGYGLQIDEVQRITVSHLAIDLIMPDATQPRRTLPAVVRAHWDGHPASFDAVFPIWWGLVNTERGQDFDLPAALQSSETALTDASENLPATGPLEAAFGKLVNLASSIHRDGLTNPITVARAEAGYLLETGERRWLAYHLLRWFFQAETWNKIPARVVNEHSVWRQASENTARDNLNAIGRARQFAVLLMDLLHKENGQRFKPFDPENEHAFYSQVVDESPPYGKSELLLSAMGMQHRAAVSRARKLLRLTPAIWIYGDEHDIAEDHLLKVVGLPDEEALEYLQNVATRNNLIAPASQREPAPRWEKLLLRIESQMTPSKWKRMKSDERQHLYERLKAVLRKMESFGLDD